MTGAEHYQAAERLVFSAEETSLGSRFRVSLLGEAGIHAVLAVAFYLEQVIAEFRGVTGPPGR